MLLLKFIEWQLALHLRDVPDYLKPHQQMLELLKTVVTNSLEMCDVGYKHPLWMPRTCVQRQYCNIMTVVRGYKRLAKYFTDIGVAGFRLKPKLHPLHHLAYSMKIVLEKPSPKLINWVVFAWDFFRPCKAQTTAWDSLDLSQIHVRSKNVGNCSRLKFEISLTADQGSIVTNSVHQQSIIE